MSGDVGGIDGGGGEDVADAGGVDRTLGHAGRLERRVGRVHLSERMMMKLMMQFSLFQFRGTYGWSFVSCLLSFVNIPPCRL